MTEKDDNKDDFEEMVKKVNENPDYKVLTREEYEAIMAFVPAKTSTPIPHTGTDPVVKPKTPKFKFDHPPLGPQGATPRLKLLLDASKSASIPKPNASGSLNASFGTQSISVPKLPFFNGSEEPQKGETSYETWSFEVKCLKNSNYLPDHLLMQAIRNSLRGAARDMLIPLGENASVEDIVNKLDGFYGNVSTTHTLIQSFYNDYQKDCESIIAYGSRLEQTLSRALWSGDAKLEMKDSMLIDKFWTGLKSQQLKNSTRHLYDSAKDFQDFLKEIRKVEQEDASSSRHAAKPKVSQQQSGQASTDESITLLSKQMSELIAKMKTFEQKLETGQQSTNVSAPQHSYNGGYNSQYSRGRGRGWRRNYNRGYSGRGSYNNRTDFSGNQNSQNDNRENQNKNQDNRRGSYSRGRGRGGTNGRGAGRGGNSKNEQQNLNS